MNFQQEKIYEVSQVTIDNFLTRIGKSEIIDTILTGLNSDKKYISSMFFYDARGSRLFEDITALEEYYPTRTEKSILEDVASHMGHGLKDMDIVELGSGDCSKISIILNSISKYHMDSIRYIPVDISQTAIEDSAHNLLEKFPDMEIYGIVADFIKQLHLIPGSRKRLFCFLGSTIGNLTSSDVDQFLNNLNSVMQPGDGLLLGMDMVKDIDILERAYNDEKNITAEFNFNILNVVNNLIGSDFKTEKFKHLAFYNEAMSRIEMHLEAMEDMEISCPYIEDSIVIKKGETIHTENSHKFTMEDIERIASSADLEVVNTFFDENKWFSLVQLIKK